MARVANVRIEGGDRLRRKLAAMPVVATKALTEGLVAAAETVITESKQRTPVDTGVLRASGVVLPPKMSGTSIEVIAGHGGPAADYAVPVHERLDVNHPVGQAKFLESAALDKQNEMARIMATVIEAALRREGV